MSRTEEGKITDADSIILTLVVIFIAVLIAYFSWWSPNHPVQTPVPVKAQK